MASRISAAAALACAVFMFGCDGSPQGAATTAPTVAEAGEDDDSGGTAGPSAAKAAVLAWARAVDAGDIGAAAAASEGDAEQIEALEAVVAKRISEAKLDAAVKRRFPRSAETHPAGGGQGLAEAVERATEKVDGDTATVWAYLEDHPLLARKNPDGQWKVALDHFTSDTESAARMWARAYELLAAEVTAGDYANPELALDALDKKVAEAAEALGVEPPAEPPGEAPADAFGGD